MKRSVLGLITARGGSKGIPQKNIAPLAGKPLIAWTIEAARRSRALDRVVVSTDDDRIAQVARDSGADVPFMRPAELAGDQAAHIPVLLHALDWLQAHDRYVPDYLMLLQPTSPLRTSEDIDRAVDLAVQKDADAVVSVCPAAHHPYLMKTIDAGGALADYVAKPEGYLPRQAWPSVYAINGALYLVKVRVLRERQSFDADRALAYVMPTERSIDIDTPWDLRLVDLLLKHPVP